MAVSKGSGRRGRPAGGGVLRLLALLAVLLLLGACYRSIDGSGNNPTDPPMGAAGEPLRNEMPMAYADGLEAPAGGDRPGARHISNVVCDQAADRPNALGASDLLWQWGQFIDHDLDLTPAGEEPLPIPVPQGDAWFDPASTGTAEIPFHRSVPMPGTGTGPGDPRQHPNEITAWLDASMVYGSDATRAAALRTLDGTGRLETSAGDLLPFNTAGLPNEGGPSPDLFLAGDVRANEQAGLTALHTLFVREHNFWAGWLASVYPGLDGDRLYEHAREIVGAEIQAITYEEFLPALLGPDPLPPYTGYRPRVDASIGRVFSTASYRFGHSMLSESLLRLDANGDPHPSGPLALAEAFFAPQEIEDDGIEPLLRGLALQRAQAVDPYVVDGVRNFLFGPPGSGGLDLAALNIQRGRDHGLPSYNEVRAAFGLAPAASFAEVSSDPEVQARLEEAYDEVDDVDAWVGGLSEDPLPGALVGELVATVLADQFARLRDGDRYFYERSLPRFQGTRLAEVIRRNTPIGDEIPDDVFHVPAE